MVMRRTRNCKTLFATPDRREIGCLAKASGLPYYSRPLQQVNRHLQDVDI